MTWFIYSGSDNKGFCSILDALVSLEMSNKFLSILSTRMDVITVPLEFSRKTSVDSKRDFLIDNASPEYLVHFIALIFSEVDFKSWFNKRNIPKSTLFSFPKHI